MTLQKTKRENERVGDLITGDIDLCVQFDSEQSKRDSILIESDRRHTTQACVPRALRIQREREGLAGAIATQRNYRAIETLDDGLGLGAATPLSKALHKKRHFQVAIIARERACTRCMQP